MTDRKRKRRRLTAVLLLLSLLITPLCASMVRGEEDAEITHEAKKYIITEDDMFVERIPEGNEYRPITSVGRNNVRVNGVVSKNTLLEYTVPDELLQADPNFAALMLEADKFIGYPFVYGASNPKEGFDCSGFVSWVFIQIGRAHV